MVRPTVAIFGKPDGVGIRLAETLLSNFCLVKILSKEKEEWEQNLSHVSQKNLFQVINPEKDKESATFEYLILLNQDLIFSVSQVLTTCRFAASQEAKTLVILPFSTEDLKNWQRREDLRGTILRKMPEAGIIYSGDIFGPRYFGADKNILTRAITGVVDKGVVEEPEDVLLYPLFTEALVRYLARSVFSFGPYGKELSLSSSKISFQDLSVYFSKMLSRKPALKRTKIERKEVLGVKKQELPADFEKNLKETLFWFSENAAKERTWGGRISPKKEVKTKAYFIKKGSRVGVAILLVLPLVLMVTGVISLYLSLKGSKKALSAASFSNRNSQKFFQVYSQIPLVGLVYKPLLPLSNVLSLSSEAGLGAVRVLETGRVFAASILGDEIYDPTPLADQISLELGDLYNKTSLLEGEIKNLKGLARKTVLSLIAESDIEDARRKILFGKALTEGLPQLLGKDAPKTYLVLFQNNMELRPTGGFIGSFALVSFDAGRLIDTNVFDVYAADGQLKGHVEPPLPIKKYLGEANWFLRDSNWDPDFPTSAERARWFLDKEIDKRVDGVIGLDLEVAKGVLRATGPVLLPDFNKAFDYNNLYEILQAEVESDFFPGSQKKASILTALTREIMNRLAKIEKDKQVSVAKEIAHALEEKHVQIYLSDRQLQDVVSKLGYSGEFSAPSCTGNCFSDWYASVDANVGVTKANYFINRSFDLGVTLSETAAKKELRIRYENTANPALGQSGRYKTYTRIFVPKNSVTQKVKIENAGVIVEANLEIEERENDIGAGISVEISPGQTKTLIFSWETPIPESASELTEYRLYVRKQAGTLADPLNASVLTQEGSYSYNTFLARDFFARIFFQ